MLILWILFLDIEFSLNPEGAIYIFKYLGNSKRYNMDVGAELKIDFIKYGNFTFFISYINELDMAEQIGNISLDPYYGHWYITFGSEMNFKKLVFFGHITHDCFHSIDRTPDSNKVVFNRFSIGIGSISFFPGYKVYRDAGWRFSYTYYPHSVFIDYLNSTDMWHDFSLFFKKRILWHNNFFIGGGVNVLITIWFNEKYPEGFSETNILLNFETGYQKHESALSFTIEYFPWANYHFKAPHKLWRLGMVYVF